MFTAVAACFGVYLGFQGLEKWRDETIGKRKTELAEQALVAFYEARDVLGWVALGVSLERKAVLGPRLPGKAINNRRCATRILCRSSG